MTSKWSKAKVAIRVDGDKRMGSGHIMRMISLANILQDQFEILFLTQERELSLIKRITSSGFSVNLLPVADNGLNEEIDLLTNIVTKEHVLVLDGYHFNYNYQKALRSFVKKLVCVDDINPGPFYADCILNHGPQAQQEKYVSHISASFCLGPDYALIQPAFIPCTKRRPISNEVSEVIVCQGGTDPNNSTLKLINGISKLERPLTVHIIIGPTNIHLRSVVKRASELESISAHSFKVHYALTHESMIEVLKGADMAIVAASTICIELCMLRIPVVTNVIAENQIKLASSIAELGCGVNLGKVEDLSEYSIYQNLLKIVESKKCREDMCKSQESNFDGRSLIRIQRLFDSLCA
ncbi:MAG: UDP-2,4-diacetamido-2,4,6-trideoxy-beta-L-altropyranose hydrolase [Oligoflexus sp.]